MTKKGQKPLLFWIKAAFIGASLPLLLSHQSWAKDCTKTEINSNIERFKNTQNAKAVLDAVVKCGEEAIAPLKLALSEDDAAIRANAASALGKMGAIAQDASQALVSALKESDETVRTEAASALIQIGRVVQNQPDNEFEWWDLDAIQNLKALKRSVDDAIDLLDKDDRDWVSKKQDLESLKRVSNALQTKLGILEDRQLYQLVQWLKANPGALVAMGSVTIYLGIFICCPILLLKLDNLVKPASFTIPWLNLPVSLSKWLVLKYHPRVLDAWVKENRDKADKKFKTIDTVKERKDYITVPLRLNDKKKGGDDDQNELAGKDLESIFSANRFCLLVWGEGGSGKTSLACQIAKWGMAEDKAKRPAKHLILPVLIEQELSNEGEEKLSLMKAINGQLQYLIDTEEALSKDLVEALVRKQRVLVIVDHLSEMSQNTRQQIRPDASDFPVKALIVTSRIKEDLGNAIDGVIETLRIDGKQLSGFIYDYLKQIGERNQFEDKELLNACGQLSEMVEERKAITVLLAKLYAEQLINSKKNPAGENEKPNNIPDLILGHLKEINQKAERKTGKEYPNFERDAKHIAWKCLEQSYKPKAINCQIVREILGGDHVEDYLDYFEKHLRLIRKVGVAKDQIRFTLDPITEYLAGLHLIDLYDGKQNEWQEFLKQADSKADTTEEIKGFLLAIRDCCLAKGSVPDFVIKELGKKCGLDPKAIEKEQRKRMVLRLIEDLDVPEIEDRLSAVVKLGAMGKDATRAIPSLSKVLEKDSEAEIRFEALRALKQLGGDDSRIPIVEIKANVWSMRLIEPPHPVKRDLGNGVTLDMVLIPGGTFMMGSPEGEGRNEEKPQHNVTVQPFLIGKYPITQAQYQEVMSKNPSNFKGDERPVELVSWDDAVEFCQRLSEKTGTEYRLPSEVEWEYACRAGTTTLYHFGDTITDKLANYNGNAGGTTSVGRFPPNAFGLCDMHGNVWEWCQDDWYENYENAPTDSSAWFSEDSKKKVLCGGSWSDASWNCRSACRDYFTRISRFDDLGFRVVCVAPRNT